MSTIAGIATVNLPNFDIDIDSKNVGQRWKHWLAKFENYLIATNITDTDRQKAMLLYHAGDRVFELYSAICATTDDFDAIKTTLTNHFDPQINKEFAIFTFRQTKQAQHEPFEQFITRLRVLAPDCNFHDKDAEIKSQIIQGCSSKELRLKALRETLTINQLINLGKTIETAYDNSRQMEDVTIKTENISHLTANSKQPNTNRNNRNSNYKRHPQPQQRASNSQSYIQSCLYCGRSHAHGVCPARGKTCLKCNGINHFANVCRSQQPRQSYNNHTNNQINNVTASNYTTTQSSIYQDEVNDNQQQDNQSFESINAISTQSLIPEASNEYILMLHSNKNSNLPHITFTIHSIPISFIIDTGATINVIDHDTFVRMQPQPTLLPSSAIIHTYQSTQTLQSMGSFNILLKHNNNESPILITVISGTAPAILGYEACQKLGIINIINTLHPSTDFTKIYPNVFQPHIGCLKNYEVTLDIDTTVKPVAFKHRRIPYHMRNIVDTEIQQMIDDDVIEHVPRGPTPWLLPALILPKKDGTIRIVCDARAANKAIKRFRYPIPTVDDIIHEMNGWKIMSLLDVRKAYHQLKISTKSRYITTFSTHSGIYRYKRMNMGINSAAEIFQYVFQTVVLVNLQGVCNISDDILVGGATEIEHNNRLHALLTRLNDLGITLNFDKCEFNKTELTFFGLKFSPNGVSLTDNKIDALINAPYPKTSGELHSFLGLVSYCSRYIPHQASITEPLRLLCRQDSKWLWSSQHSIAIDTIKASLRKHALAYFDPTKLTEIIADASPVGLGAVLMQAQSPLAGDTKIISFASRTLTDVEKRYSHIEKEGLAAVWACEKFHLYIYGRSFTLTTDNKALEYIFKNPKTKTPARIERWCLRLAQYQYNVKHRPGSGNPADYLSRNPVATPTQQHNIAEAYINYIFTNAIPASISTTELQNATLHDPTLSAVKHCLLHEPHDPQLITAFKQILNELSITADGIIIRGHRVIIPASLQQRTIALAHEGHQGIVKTKELLRSTVWFPNIDSMVSNTIQTCYACQINNPKIDYEPFTMSIMPSQPWQDLACDFYSADTITLLVIIDEYSRYPVIQPVTSTAANAVIPQLHSTFATFGNPIHLNADNGPPFNGAEFERFCNIMGIKRRSSTPYWPRGNGECERFMPNLTKVFINATLNNTAWQLELNFFLAAYRSTPHSSTKIAPASLLFKYATTSRLSSLHLPPLFTTKNLNLIARTNDAHAKKIMKREIDQRLHVQPLTLQIGDLVLYQPPMTKIKNKLMPKRHLTPYTIKAIHGSAITAQSNNHTITRNSSHFKPYHQPVDMSLSTPITTRAIPLTQTMKPTKSPSIIPQPKSPMPPNPLPASINGSESPLSEATTAPPTINRPIVSAPTTPFIQRASSRITNPPRRLQISTHTGSSYD